LIGTVLLIACALLTQGPVQAKKGGTPVPAAPGDMQDQILSPDLRALLGQGPLSSTLSDAVDQTFSADVKGQKYVKLIVSAHLPNDPELTALRTWVTNWGNGGKGSVHYRYVSFQGLAVAVPLNRVKQLAQQPGVRYIAPNRFVSGSALSYQSLATTTGRAEAGAANTGLTGAGVGIAVLDSGIDFRHASLPDFSNTTTGRKVAGRVDFVALRKARR
jgi:hypothetical protein